MTDLPHPLPVDDAGDTPPRTEGRGSGYGDIDDTPGPDSEHVGQRAELLPEEQAVGSADPEAQAEAILAESVERTEHPDPEQSVQSALDRQV